MSIQCLPLDIISSIGEHLDLQSRINANVASKVFKDIHRNIHNQIIHVTYPNFNLKNKLGVINKLQPNLVNVALLFDNFKHVPQNLSDLKTIDHLNSDIYLHVAFNECSPEFITKVVESINFKIYQLILNFSYDYSNKRKVFNMMNAINECCTESLIKLTVTESESFLTMLKDTVFASKVVILSIIVPPNSACSMNINLNNIIMRPSTKIHLELNNLQNVKTISSIYKVTSMYLVNTSSHYSAVATALSNEKNKMMMNLLSLENPDLSHAYDSDSSIYQILKDCQNEHVVLRLYCFNNDIISFIPLLFETHKYKRLELVCENEQDVICGRILQLLYKKYSIDVIASCHHEHLEVLDIRDLLRKMNDETKWKWHWLTFLGSSSF